MQELHLNLVDSSSPKDLIEAILAAPTELKPLGISLLWTWWQARNKVNADGATLNLGAILFQIRKFGQQFNVFFVKEGSKQTTPVQTWMPRVGDMLKIDIDGSFLQ
jgi:hypothetical protein